MNTKFKKLWLAALRGGNYQQGRHALRNENNRCCCLGVAADLLVQQGRARWAGIARGTHTLSCGDLGGYWGMLPPNAREMIGLTSDDVDLLARMNDEGDSFKKIADYIERSL